MLFQPPNTFKFIFITSIRTLAGLPVSTVLDIVTWMVNLVFSSLLIIQLLLLLSEISLCFWHTCSASTYNKQSPLYASGTKVASFIWNTRDCSFIKSLEFSELNNGRKRPYSLCLYHKPFTGEVKVNWVFSRALQVIIYLTSIFIN